jgi:hypothetical protein
VASQPTVEVGLLFFVTGNAEAHFEIYAFDPVHGFHFPMALGAGNLLLDMPFVVKHHVFSQIIGLSPRRGCSRIEILVLFFDLGMTSNDIFMAIEAFFHRRHTWMFGASHIGMTELTLDKLYPRMEMVAKWYGLLRANILRRNIEEI